MHLWQVNLEDPKKYVCERCGVTMTKKNAEEECPATEEVGM